MYNHRLFFSSEALFFTSALLIIALAIIVSAFVFSTCLYYGSTWAKISIAPDSLLHRLRK